MNVYNLARNKVAADTGDFDFEVIWQWIQQKLLDAKIEENKYWEHMAEAFHLKQWDFTGRLTELEQLNDKRRMK